MLNLWHFFELAQTANQLGNEKGEFLAELFFFAVAAGFCGAFSIWLVNILKRRAISFTRNRPALSLTSHPVVFLSLAALCFVGAVVSFLCSISLFRQMLQTLRI